MEVKTPDANVGVIIGRFQTPDLHEGHTNLIDHVVDRHKKVIILVGSTPGVYVTRRNPLDFFTRKMMLQEKYPEVTVLPISDMQDDGDWSYSVDQRIIEVCGDHESVLLYGSRDSFVPAYRGRFDTVELDSSCDVSATEARALASNDVRADPLFRRGVVYAAHNRHPVTFPTVDIVVVKYGDAETNATHIAIGHKKSDKAGQWRFPGGFVDPRRDVSLEDAAKREVSEELGQVGIGDLRYIGSCFIDDWRYRNEVDGIMTSIFVAKYTFGQLQAGDDLHEAMWASIEDLKSGRVRLLSQHQEILNQVLTHLEKE